MTTFRPLDPVPGEVTVQNDGNVPTSYAVEVAIGRSLPQGFQTETSRLVFTEVLEPGESAQVPVPVTIPSQAVAGPKTVRVRLGTPSILGTIQRVLGQEFFSNRLNVTIPQELPLPGPPEPPAPEGLEPGDVTLHQPTASPTEVQPGNRVSFSIPVQVASVPGLPRPMVRVQADLTRNGQIVDQLPAEEFDISSGTLNRLPQDWVVPSDAEAASYGLRVRLWDPATVGAVGDLALRTFSGLFQVLAPAPSPDELAQQFRQGLGTPSLSASPREVDLGQTVRVFYQVPTSASFSFNPSLALDVLGPGSTVVRSPLDRRISVAPGAAIAGQVDINTSDLEEGQSYGVGISLVDPITNTSLLERTFGHLFSIRTPSVPTPPPGPAPTAAWQPGDLSLPAVSIPSIEPGDRVDMPLSISNPRDKRLPAVIEPALIPPTGPRVPLSSIPFTPSGPNIPITLGFEVPQNAASGLWQLHLVVRDPTQAITIASRTYNFQVLIPEIPPEPLPPPPAPGFRQGDITLTSLSVSDTSPRDGDRITIRVQFGVARRQVRDEFVRISLTVIDQNNRVVEVIPQEDFDVTIGQQNTVTFDWTVEADPGPHGFLIRIWDPDTLSREGLLLDTRRTSVFTVEERPPTAGPPAPQLISVSAPTITPSTVEPGEIITGEWTLRNPLNTTMRAYLFLDGPGGGNGVPRTFSQGETETLRVLARVTSGVRPGSLTYGLAVRDANTQRTIGNLVRALTITVLAEEQPTPGPVPTPPPPEEEGILPGELVAEAPSSQPLVADPGDQVDIGFTFRNQSGDSGNLNLLVFPRDPNNNARGTLRATFNISPRGTATPTLSFRVPGGALSGAWGVQVFVWDDRTFVAGDENTYLVNRLYQGVFRVG